MARSDRRLRSVVGSPFAAGLFLDGFEHPRLVGDFLCAWRCYSIIRTTWPRFIAPTIARKISRNIAFFTVHTTALIAADAGLLSHFWVSILPWIFTVYLTWSPWHYSGQNYGLFMMFARRAGAKPSDCRTARALRSLHRFLSDSFPRLSHRGVFGSRCFISLGIPSLVSRCGQITARRNFRCVLVLRLVAAGTGYWAGESCCPA